MKFAVGITTHNAISFGRVKLLERTIDSVLSAFGSAILMDNGSGDGTLEFAMDLFDSDRVRVVSSWDGYGSYGPGRGRNCLQSQFMGTGADVCVCSDDDVVWRPDAASFLTDWMSSAPEDVVLLSGLLEPEWSWNTVRGVVDAGGRRALWRDSAPGAAWCYRRRHMGLIFPIGEVLREDLGEDYEACLKLRGAGYMVAQADLAEHVGVGKSTHGNSSDTWAKPLDRERWGI